MDSKKTQITICGGGNLAHFSAAVIGSKPDFTVNILTRQPQKWSKTVTGYTNLKGSYWENRGNIIGNLNIISDDPKEACKGSKVFIICGPAHIHTTLLEKISPYAEKDTYVGTCYGQGAFDLMANFILGKKIKDNNITLFALQNVPAICKIIKYGESIQIIGPKKRLCVATHPPLHDKKARVESIIEGAYGIPTLSLPNFMNITLTPSNQIIHPGRTYAVFKDWDGKQILKDENVPLLYEHTDDFSAAWIQILDDEIQAIKGAILKKYPDYDLSAIIPIKDRIIKQYGEQVKDTRNLKTVFCSNIGYSVLKFPLIPKDGGVVLNLNARFFHEDIPYGLCILRDIGRICGIETPGFDKMIRWHQSMMGKTFLNNDGTLNKNELQATGAPSKYNINTMEDLLGISSNEIKAKL